MSSKGEERYLTALSKRIALVRKQKGYTQEKLANEADMDRVALAYIESGKRKPTVTTVFKISIALDVAPSVFFDNL